MLEIWTILAGLTHTAESVSQIQYGWHSVGYALLITLGVIIVFFVVQTINNWIFGRVARPRPSPPPSSEGNLDPGNDNQTQRV